MSNEPPEEDSEAIIVEVRIDSWDFVYIALTLAVAWISCTLITTCADYSKFNKAGDHARELFFEEQRDARARFERTESRLDLTDRRILERYQEEQRRKDNLGKP